MFGSVLAKMLTTVYLQETDMPWSSALHFSVYLPISLNFSMNRYGFYKNNNTILYISSVQLLHRVSLFETPWTAARQASLSITNSRS